MDAEKRNKRKGILRVDSGIYISYIEVYTAVIYLIDSSTRCIVMTVVELQQFSAVCIIYYMIVV